MRPWRGALAVSAAVIVAVVLGVFVGTATLALPTPAPEPSLALASPPTPRPTPNPSPTTAPDGLTVYPVGPLPENSRIVVTGDAGDERLLLLDVVNRRARLVAHFQGFGAYKDARVIELSANSSGLLLVSLRAAVPTTRLYFIRPATADVRSYTIANAESPRLSPDGSTIAVSRNFLPDQKGLWLLNTSDGSGRRITTDDGRRSTRAVQWSADGTRLSALIEHLDFTRELIIVGVDGSISSSFGAATDVRWRGEDLVFWNNSKAGPVNMLRAGKVSPAYESPPGVLVSLAEFRPQANEIAMRVSTQTTAPRLVLYDPVTATTKEQLADATWLISMWWSRDGRSLYVWILDKTISIVRDVMSGEDILTFCFRQRVEPPCGP